jgi:hypothetical protein
MSETENPCQNGMAKAIGCVWGDGLVMAAVVMTASVKCCLALPYES